MDTKVADIMTDSDSSSSSNSWVFVDEHNISDMNAPNQFYLNCSGEPVQELTENDLGVVDCDSDSDGISVISETEDSLKESSSDDLSQEFFTTANICRRDDVVESIGSNIGTAERVVPINENSINLKKLFITSSLIGAGVVVVAILIAPYITPKVDNDISIDDVGVDIPKKYHTKSREVFHCQREHKKRRLSVSFPPVAKIHNDSKQYRKHQEFDVKRDEKKYLENDYHVKYSTYKTDNIKHANSIEREEDDELLIVAQNKKSKKRNKNDDSFSCEHEFKSKEKKLKAKEEYLAKKEEYLVKKEYELLKIKVKLEKKLNKYIKSEINENHNSCNNGKKNKKQHKTEQYLKKMNKSDGAWYTNFQKHRENLRKKQNTADWLFDRASDRAKRRDEARWYFHWMVGREEGRFRRPLKRQHA